MNSKNIYEDRLEALTSQEMLDGLAGVGIETGRLEVMRERIATHKIAYIACSMANADGGIISIGIQEPDENDVSLASCIEPFSVRAETVDSLVFTATDEGLLS